MTLTEFKAFLDGFEYGFRGDAPSPEQWQVIKDKLHQVYVSSRPAYQTRIAPESVTVRRQSEQECD